jgi:predicted phosphate transport protein (TIGR00153 family)
MKFFQSNREKFYDLFEELADKLVEGGKLFTEIIGNYEYSEFKVGKLKEIEHEADHITHQVYKRMHKVFLTPLDREDIYLLANKMDSVLDEIESAAVRMYLYRMKEPAKELVQITGLLTEAIELIRKIVFSVRKKQDAPLILKLCVEINTLENEADQLYRSAMVRLFEEEKDAIELIKVKDIIGRIETALDNCEDVSNIIEGIVLKYS